jgi:uncharacterized protein YukE
MAEKPRQVKPSLRARYNPEYYHNLAEKHLDGVSAEEAIAWHSHACTQSLLASLEGDLDGIVTMWVGGGYSNEDSIDATSQLNAKARGMAEALEDVIKTIEEIKNLKLEGESYD